MIPILPLNSFCKAKGAGKVKTEVSGIYIYNIIHYIQAQNTRRGQSMMLYARHLMVDYLQLRLCSVRRATLGPSVQASPTYMQQMFNLCLVRLNVRCHIVASKGSSKHQRLKSLHIDYFHVLIRSLRPHAIIYGQHHCRIGFSDYLRFKVISYKSSFTGSSPGQTARGTVSIPACVVDIRHLIGPTC